MKIIDNPPVHLTYCLNVHPGETWEENFEAIETLAFEVRKQVAQGQAFGLGLRLGFIAADDLISSPETLKRFKSFLEKHDIYVFTINGFPYGDFHGTKIKEKVYYPDWRSKERLDYTTRLADILSKLIPHGISGSISTVPGAYKEWIRSDQDRNMMIHNLMACVAHLANIREKTGQDLHMGLEPEPDCFLETTNEIVAFFTRDLSGEGKRHLARLTGRSEQEAWEMIGRHLGICFDTCHMSLQFENLTESIVLLKAQGIRLSKIQISSAFKIACTAKNLEKLAIFCEPVYLHQVKSYRDTEGVVSYGDLPMALENRGIDSRCGEEWRIHFHVPLYFNGNEGLQSTSGDLTRDFFNSVVVNGCEHLEIETYTFNVLPENLRARGVVQSISDEYAWVLNKIKR